MGLTARVAGVVALFFVAVTVSAQSVGDFTKVVDFNATLESLSKAAQANQPISTGGRLVVLNGIASSIQSLSNNPKQFFAMIELVDGSWNGLQSVSLYRCYVLAQGPQFSSQVLLRPSSNSPANAISTNSHLLVVGEVKGIVAAPDGGNVPVVQAYFLRPID